jgi:hypothetical protein
MLLVELRDQLLALKVPLAALNGYKMAKYVMRIEVVESLKHIARCVAVIGQTV